MSAKLRATCLDHRRTLPALSDASQAKVIGVGEPAFVAPLDSMLTSVRSSDWKASLRIW